MEIAKKVRIVITFIQITHLSSSKIIKEIIIVIITMQIRTLVKATSQTLVKETNQTMAKATNKTLVKTTSKTLVMATKIIQQDNKKGLFK